MCLPWNHKWETLDSSYKRVYGTHDRPSVDLPIRTYKLICQTCTHCGKEIVRKYRV